jgi:hypothetical protein
MGHPAIDHGELDQTADFQAAPQRMTSTVVEAILTTDFEDWRILCRNGPDLAPDRCKMLQTIDVEISGQDSSVWGLPPFRSADAE